MNLFKKLFGRAERKSNENAFNAEVEVLRQSEKEKELIRRKKRIKIAFTFIHNETGEAFLFESNPKNEFGIEFCHKALPQHEYIVFECISNDIERDLSDGKLKALAIFNKNKFSIIKIIYKPIVF